MKALNRKMDETPWQLAQAREWARLYDLLADLGWFEAMYEHSNNDLLMYWASVEAQTEPKLGDVYQLAIKDPNFKSIKTLI
jgi:hypothetical protein